MNKIWANRLIAGTKEWDDVPPSRKTAVLVELRSRVEEGEITVAIFEGITGESF